MNLFLLYLLLLKATMTSFSGFGSLPSIHADLVVQHRALTEAQLNTAVAAGRSGPGPVGVYVVNVGYQAAGVPGAIAGWLAMVTPAFLIIPLLRYFSRHADNARVRSAIRAIVLASAGLLVSSMLPLGRDSVTDVLTGTMAVSSFAIMAFTKAGTLWMILAAAAVGAAAALF